jgi:dGTPase
MAVDSGREHAPYAVHPRLSRGRLRPEPESPSRNVFRRDCDRVIHSAAFRRLKHKTQVFVVHEGDHYRTRLTHTLEVTQIARSLARALGLDEDLSEGLALAHDLGHPPFGHAGEQALDQCMSEHGGFDHNVQTLRVVTSLERRYAAFDGLNLTLETLEGLIKHNGALKDATGTPAERYRARGIPPSLLRYAEIIGIAPEAQASAEAQAAAISDDIAYDAHDLDDGLRAGLFAVDDLADVPLIRELLVEIHRAHGALETPRLVHELIRRVITVMIQDVASASEKRLNALAADSPDGIRNASNSVVGFSPAMVEADRAIKAFLFPRMYRHARVNRVVQEAKVVVRELFQHFSSRPGDLPTDWQTGLEDATDRAGARRIADFIAGMTDNFALAEHARHFDSTPRLR